MDVVKRSKSYRVGQIIGWVLGIFLCLAFPPLAFLIIFRREIHF
jgi:hypothetical protein